MLSKGYQKKIPRAFLCVVPQHLEQSTNRSIDIRNNDLSEVVKADLILLNFDGTGLDSGTVIEFLFAKALEYQPLFSLGFPLSGRSGAW
ncbi:MAG: hypothetical protein Ct9H300mP21_06600 [Pseudomonadota bacterium]|nr:MAG: hypothetical protein Ct9H300mP21_06600 [Pseudomonadota bacterium]